MSSLSTEWAVSMLEAGEKDAFWVMEIGISAPGEMEVLAAIAEPDVAVIHNVGPAHLEALGDVAGVAAAKTELFRHLRPGGIALASMELAKVVLVFYLAYFFSQKQKMVRSFSVGFIPPVLVTGFLGLILLLQPDFGGAVFLGMPIFWSIREAARPLRPLP